MAGIRDRDFLTACARLASCLNLSAAAARQRVDVQARKDGIRDPKEKLALVERLLEEAKQDQQKQEARLDDQLEALESEVYFLTED